MIYAGTGHRPDKIFQRDPYSEANHRKLVGFIRGQFVLLRLDPDEVISGMALGWDIALAQACAELGIPFAAYVPFKGQESKWPKVSRDRYTSLLDRAGRVVVVCEGGYAAWKMQRRNERMCDDCEGVLALWDGSAGGTGNFVEYARKTGKTNNLINFWGLWVDDK